MPINYNSDNFNPASLNVPNAYINVKRPPGYIRAALSGLAVMYGAASWGPMDTPVLTSDIKDYASKFGALNSAAITDPYDMATHGIIALSQAQSLTGIQLYCTRIGDGTQVKASIFLKDVTPDVAKNGLKLTGLHFGTEGNNIQASIKAGNKTNTYNIEIVSLTGLGVERYTNIDKTNFWANAMAAINQGQNQLRGKSQLVVASNPDNTALDPALAAYMLAGGTDGRAGITSAHFVGNPTAEHPTGLYSILGKKPVPSVMWFCGLTDSDVFSTIQAVADSLGVFTLLNFPKGTSVATAVTAKKTLGIDTPNIAFCKDYVNWYDSINGMVRSIDPSPFIGGRITALDPQNSPLNKAIYGVIGTERVNDETGWKPYSDADIGQMNDHGILFIHNPIPAGDMWGLPVGNNSSSDEPRRPVEYARLTNWFVHSLNGQMGKFIGQNQTDEVDDPLRAEVKKELDTFLKQAKNDKKVVNWKVICDLTNNDLDSIAQHYMYADVYVRYPSSVHYFIINFQGGTTVKIETRILTEAEAQQIGV